MAMASITQTHNHVAHHPQLFTALTSSTTLSQLKQIHAQILRSTSNSNTEYSNSLLFKLVLSSCTLSSSSSSLDYALSVFSQIPNPHPRFSNQLLRHFSRSSTPDKTLFLYRNLRTNGSTLDCFSFPPLLKAVSKVSAFNYGLEIHGLASKLGFNSDPFIQTALISMYASCRRIMDARLLFDKMSERDVITWNTIIDGYHIISSHVL